MPKKLTPEQVLARITMYEEAAQHLAMSVHDNDEERRQSVIVHNQIMKMCADFERSNAHILEENR